MQATMTVECPKCRVSMRHIQREGVTVELCPDCGGMFLDRGELEHLIRAEQSYNERQSLPEGRTIPGSRTRRERRDEHVDRFDEDRYDEDYYADDRPHGDSRRRRRGFLSDFLDFG